METVAFGLGFKSQRGSDKLRGVFLTPSSGFRSARSRPGLCGPTAPLRIPGEAPCPHVQEGSERPDPGTLYVVPPQPLRAPPQTQAREIQRPGGFSVGPELV